MSEFHRVTERLSVAPQLAPEDMATAAQRGFVRVVCNRPDGTVAVHAEGTEEQLAELAFDLSRGPRYARVRAVEPADATPEDHPGFSILRTEPTP